MASDTPRGQGARPKPKPKPSLDGSLLEPQRDPEEPGERRVAADRERDRYIAERPPHHEAY